MKHLPQWYQIAYWVVYDYVHVYPGYDEKTQERRVEENNLELELIGVGSKKITILLTITV